MKKLLSVLAALSIVCGLASSGFSSVEPMPCVAADTEAAEEEYDFSSPIRTVTDGIFQYEMFDGYAALEKEVSDDNSAIEELSIPEEINGIPVVGIESWAFEECTNLKKIELSKNIKVFMLNCTAENLWLLMMN